MTEQPGKNRCAMKNNKKEAKKNNDQKDQEEATGIRTKDNRPNSKHGRKMTT
jgi:hypothetical protein